MTEQNNYFKDLIKASDNKDATVASKDVFSKVTGFVDTGSYLFNALLSGSLYGGIAENKITGFAGESGTGKSFLLLGIISNFLKQDKNNTVLFFETEGALTDEVLKTFEIDSERLIIFPSSILETFATQLSKVLTFYEKNPKKEGKILLCLDSLSMLPSRKEVDDVEKGSEKRDLTKSQLIRGIFRVFTLRLSRLKLPFIVTNHTYKSMDMFSTGDKLSGGEGLRFAASSIAIFSKKKERDGTDITGNILHTMMFKSRLSKEFMKKDLLIRYDKGLQRHYGLLQLGEKYKIITKSAGRYLFPNEAGELKKYTEKAILKDPERFFTDELMEKLEVAANQEFKYGEYIENDKHETLTL